MLLVPLIRMWSRTRIVNMSVVVADVVAAAAAVVVVVVVMIEATVIRWALMLWRVPASARWIR